MKDKYREKWHMAKKQRSARLVNLALNQIDTDSSSLNTSNRSTDQNWTRIRAKVLSTHFECETHTESCNALDHAESIIDNIQHSKRDVTSPHLKKNWNCPFLFSMNLL
ncbi:unnamed protein product [Parnassius apollo]|uniref:(apollo) hypothetical protein n=1 Tax=Parnassius apollo TaxID=110799 RepID=A0A8S3XZV6_PARAO|nr:unnamed protein product [Parnassius apollo]